MKSPPPPFNPLAVTRRHFFKAAASGLGGFALSSLLGQSAHGAAPSGMDVRLPDFAPKAKRVIYLFQSGGPSQLDKLAELNRHQFEKELDPEIESRVAQYEMAFRMQTSVPGVTDLSGESDATFALYGEDSRKPGTFAANCLLARRLAERGVRFIQLYHQGWDQHGDLPKGIRGQCKETDQASAALVRDLKQRGLLDDTLVVWGGEFGRTAYRRAP